MKLKTRGESALNKNKIKTEKTAADGKTMTTQQEIFDWLQIERLLEKTHFCTVAAKDHPGRG